MEVGQEFNSYEDLESAFKDICNANNWTFVKHGSKSVKIANKELKSFSQPYSAKFRYRYVRFRCKHGGSTRREGKGLRPNQRETYLHYPEERRLDKNSKDKAKSLLEFGVKVKLIKNHLESDTEKHVTIRDYSFQRQGRNLFRS